MSIRQLHIGQNKKSTLADWRDHLAKAKSPFIWLIGCESE